MRNHHFQPETSLRVVRIGYILTVQHGRNFHLEPSDIFFVLGIPAKVDDCTMILTHRGVVSAVCGAINDFSARLA